MQTFTFQLYSDIHLELFKSFKFPKIKPLTDYLFLAGDIGKINMLNYEPFFNYCSENWKKVFYVLGNHEFYHSKKDFKTLKTQYQTFFTKYKNVFLLDDNHIELDNIIIFGNVLWSHPNSSEYLNDFTHIKMLKEDIHRKYNIKIEQYQDLHKKSCDYILKELKKHNNKNIIIMTHFPPSQNGTSNPKYNNQSEYLKDYFASNFINEIPEKNDIVCWIYGHTHFSNFMDSTKNFKFVSNQMGYTDEINDTNFNEEGLFKITLKY